MTSRVPRRPPRHASREPCHRYSLYTPPGATGRSAQYVLASARAPSATRSNRRTAAAPSPASTRSLLSTPALDAAYIVPYGEGGDHALENGLLLRADVHRLFDEG